MTTQIKGNDTSTFGGNIDVPQIVTDAPAFKAVLSADQTGNTAAFTKVQINTVDFDLTSDFDTSNYRWIPSVAGYYHIMGQVYINTLADGKLGISVIYKNGTEFARGSQHSNGSTVACLSIASTLVYMNGTTDYVELYGYHNNASSLDFKSSIKWTNFSGHLVRAV